MVRPQDKTSLRDLDMPSWEDDGGCVEAVPPHRDPNSLLVQEQTSIMNEAAAVPEVYEMHRNASLDTRELINATPYPENERHVFAQERAEKSNAFEESLRNLIRSVEGNERLLAAQFADGEVSVNSFQSRSRFLRQDRARLADMSGVNHSEKAS
ncbi:hypothetical protein [Sphingomonas quercus]|uniref:Uncharacterized protein n=1 Tax=Sphingomonas quercus TaxID=2842451 RepID=A0ABS6BH87_9SPHN|nr:hypothetical protein [Sphingomonas quercus]MBU3077668.1 hypothetical protein [Sphingomonas quercus]